MRGFDGFYDAYQSTGYGYEGMSTEADLEGFFEFLRAYYPETSHTEEEWNERREDWREWSDTDYVDWDAVREALEEISPPQ